MKNVALQAASPCRDSLLIKLKPGLIQPGEQFTRYSLFLVHYALTGISK